jgi:hypothetical protein
MIFPIRCTTTPSIWIKKMMMAMMMVMMMTMMIKVDKGGN